MDYDAVRSIFTVDVYQINTPEFNKGKRTVFMQDIDEVNSNNC